MNYCQSYAYYAPSFRQLWKSQGSVACHAAMADIYATLPLHDHESAYSGKLYAELDAIRDRLLEIEQNFKLAHALRVGV